MLSESGHVACEEPLLPSTPNSPGTQTRPAIFCISTYEKGQAFLREAASLGAEVSLLTVDKLRDADWPRDSLTHFDTMPADLRPEEVLRTISYLARNRRINRIVALDEFDLEVAALTREHMRLPGLGETSTRFFRDKLAMRTEARRAGLAVPDFTGVFLHADLAAFMASVPGPWLLKPRTSASAIGIRRIESAEALWPVLDELGDLQTSYILERFVPGQVFHIEGVTWDRRIVFERAFRYGRPPMETMHQGGVFTTRTLDEDSPEATALSREHGRLLGALGLPAGVTHTEFIQAREDGRFYFLETAARVGGAYIAEVLEQATNVNPWVEWARIEVALARGETYALPEIRHEFAGSVISLARQAEPDLSAYTDPEIVGRVHKTHHAGLLLRSANQQRLEELLDTYEARFLADFNAVLAPPAKPTS